MQRTADGGRAIPLAEHAPIHTEPWHHILEIPSGEGLPPARAIAVDAPLVVEGYELCGRRESYDVLPRELYEQSGKAFQIIYWDKNNAYCGVCGSPLRRETSISKRCPGCGKEVWPQLAPAVIVLIKRGDEVLLVQSRKFKRDYYGLVAGFVEPGETLEAAVAREVKEETGISITAPRYFGSQPWPYPSGVMIGFVAEYVSGSIALQKEELTKGGWFTKNAMPPIPAKLSIARQMIDAWVEGSV